MFKLDGKLKFVNVDMDYLRHLHDACSEVFYKPNDYSNKPYLGVLLTNNDKKYVLPLTSAKEKHKAWKDSYPDRFLVYAIEDKSAVSDSAICVPAEDDKKVKHILSAVEISDDSNDKYYVKEMRISGSNDVVSKSTFSVTKDNSYVVAYGVGAVVPYIVKYLDGAGNALAQQNTFYGAIGDEVYVPYKYIDGYIPNALNFYTTSLKENDEFVFTYTKASGGQAIYNTTTSTSYGVVEGKGQMTYQFVPAAVREVAGNGQAGGAANGNNEVAIEDTQTPTAADVIDIDDEDVAKAGEAEKMFDVLERTAMVIAILGLLLILLTIGATIKEKHDNTKYD